MGAVVATLVALDDQCRRFWDHAKSFEPVPAKSMARILVHLFVAVGAANGARASRVEKFRGPQMTRRGTD